MPTPVPVPIPVPLPVSPSIPPPAPWLPARTPALPVRALAPALLVSALFDALLLALTFLLVLGLPRVLLAQSAPSLSTAPHNGDARRVGFCAAGCFDASAAYSAPAYVSLDQPRSVSLVYSSAQAAPRALVQVDATDNSSTPPAKMSLRLKRSDGSWVTFSNGSSEIFFQSGSGTTRLSAQFDASGLPTGAYPHTAVVRSWRGDGSFAESTVPVRVLVLNERSSPYGAGWTVGGLQRAHTQSDGSVVISEGDGSVLFFQKSGSNYLAPPGDFSTLTFDGSNYLRRYPDGTEVRFYTNGLQNYVKDRFANRTTFNYDTNQRLIKVTDPAGKITNLAYGSDGKLATITDPTNRVSTITIDGAGDLTGIQDPGGKNALLATYDASHRMKKRTDRRGGSWGFAYDAHGKLAADTLPTVTADGGSTRPTPRFRSLEMDLLPGSGSGTSSSPAPRVVPGSSGLRAELTNARGKTTKLELDKFGAPTRIEEPLGRTTTLTRNSHSQVTRVTKPSGHATDFTWSGPDLTRTYDRTTAQTVNYAYEPTYHGLTQVSGDTDPVWNYWSGGKLDSTRVGSSSRPVSRFTYDSRGRVVTSTNPKGHVTRAFYDSGNSWMNTDSAVAPGGRRSKVAYDSYGRAITATDPDNKIARAQYDVMNRTTRSIGPGADTTTYSYDNLFPTQVRDAKGQSYGTAPNALGWADTDTDPNAQQRRSAYDKNGNLTRWTNRRGQTVTFTYDDLNQLRSRTADGKTTFFYKDPAGRFVATSNAESTDTIHFDVLGRPTWEVSVRDGRRYVIGSTYDRRNLRTRLEAWGPWSGSKTIQYRYNAQMQLDTLIDLAGGRTRIAYDANRQASSITLPSGLGISVGYPSTGRPGSIRYSNATVDDAFGQSYRYGKRPWVTERMNAYADTSRSYSYDNQGRLASFTDHRNTAPSCAWNEDFGQQCSYGSRTQLNSASYSYDKVGNPTHSGAQVTTGNRLTRFNGWNLEYDADGNVTRKYQRDGNGNITSDQRFHWNSLNQLDSLVIVGSCTVPFGYDGWGRKVRTGCRQSGYLRTFLFDGDDVLMVLDENHAIESEYTAYPGTDRPHSVRRGGQTYYYMSDFPGNVIGLINSSNQVKARYGYGPFGDLQSLSDQVGNLLRYMGVYTEQGGLQHFRNRWYDPDLQRFLSEDPIGLAGGINPYSFVNNSPANYRDPYGLLLGAVGDFIGDAVGAVGDAIGDAVSAAWDYAPGAVAGFGAIALLGAPTLGIGPALLGAAEAIGSAAAGSAVAAGAESLLGRASFGSAFQRNFNLSGAALAGSATAAFLGGGGIAGAGSNGLLQGYVRAEHAFLNPLEQGGGLTLGSGAFLGGPRNLLIGGGATLGAHEFGHTLQFIGLSGALGGIVNPWWPYLGLGAASAVGGPGSLFWGFDTQASALGRRYLLGLP